jgi:inosine-uridine nucleoside N-ribohydrolase
MGAMGTLAATKNEPLSPASEFLIKEAMREDSMPLYVLCMGAITNIAAALQACPEIASRMTVIWIAGRAYDASYAADFREYNAGNDIPAANIALNSGVELWQIPVNVYGSMRIGLAELQKRVYPCGEIGKHLFEYMIQYNLTERADWTPGESWTLGDSPAVGVVLDENCGRFEFREAPIINEDTSYTFVTGRPLIRVYQSIDSRYILEDFISKLELLYGKP